MHSFKELSEKFNKGFEAEHFPKSPASLYEPGNYFLSIGGKRIRPVMCLLGNELFSDIHSDAYQLANAVELFHNFTLVHDDMMDEASLRRGKTTVHVKYDNSTALLVGDVMVIRAYEYIQTIQAQYLPKILQLFNKTAKEVCEGQQLDMDFSKLEKVSMDEYIHMITLKTSVLLAASLEMGAILGGASVNNCQHLYEFGKKIGIAFQVQDELLSSNAPDKVEKVLSIFKSCGVDAWAEASKAKYMQEAFAHLESIAVVSDRKKPLIELANYLMNRNQ